MAMLTFNFQLDHLNESNLKNPNSHRSNQSHKAVKNKDLQAIQNMTRVIDQLNSDINTPNSKDSIHQFFLQEMQQKLVDAVTKTNSILQLITAYADLDHSTIANLNPDNEIAKLVRIQNDRNLIQTPKTNVQISSNNNTVMVGYKGQNWAYKGRGYKGHLREFLWT